MIRPLLGFVAGLLIAASSAAHSLLGWPAQRDALVALGASPVLVTTLGAGWHFGGVAILTFGTIALIIFGARLRRRAVSAWPVRIIAVAYVLFGLVTFIVTRTAFFLAVFLLPGAMLAIAAWPGRVARLPRPGRASP